MNCPNCGFDCPPEMRYCGMCGARLAQVCPACNFANPASYRYCGMCGARLTAEALGGAAVALPPSAQSSPPLLPTEVEAIQRGPVALPLEGERRVVTVILTDFTGSTPLLEKVGTEAWVELMNRLLHILETEVYRFGGEVDQFRGDGLVAFFGATSAHEDDPERAVLAALAMQEALGRYASQLAQHGEIDLRMRVGVDTGEVIVASVGDRRQHSEATAMGVAVAIAARMEAAAEPGTVLVSENNYRLVEAHFRWQPLGTIPVKGMSQPMAVYRPLAYIAHADRPPQPAFPYSIPLVGREAEFQTLKHSVEGLFDGRGRIVMLTGDKGSGKSFLANEVREYFIHRGALLAETQTEAAPEVASLTWLRGRCRSYSQTRPYSMWLDLLHDWLGMRLEEADKEKMRVRLRRQAEALWGEGFGEHYPYLATFLSLPLEAEFTEKVRHLDGEGLRRRFFLAVRNWVEALSQSGPLALAFSDMHWADTSSLNLLKHCLPVCDHEALLCLLVFRPERASPVWDLRHFVETEYPHRLARVELSPLTEAQSSELIDCLIGPDALSPETRSLIIRNAEGNPYYIQELIHSLIAEGVLDRDSESRRWRMTRAVTTLDLPDNLQRLLLARIDQLAPEERHVLQVAAVIGPVFWLDLLQALAGEARPLKASLAALQRAQLVQESGRIPELGMQYQFKSTLVRDAAYESLLTAQRAGYHLKAAEYLEGLVKSEAVVGYYGLLAYHYRRAGNSQKELFYALLAAEQARKIYASAETLQHYTRALELLDQMEVGASRHGQLRAIYAQRFEVLKGRREVYYQLGSLEAARADARALLPLAQQMADDPAWKIDALLAPLFALDSREELEEGMRLAREALALSQQAGDRQREMQSRVAIASIGFYLRDPVSKEMAERALDLARQLGDLTTEVNLLVGMGGAYGVDDLPRSQEYLEAALAKSEKLNDKATELALLGALGPQLERRGDYYRQLTEYEQKRLRISREIGNRLVEGQALMFCGQVQGLYLGDHEAGLELQQQALRIWEELPSRLFPLLRMAQLQTASGQYEEALATLDAARPISAGIFDELGRVGLRLVTAILYNTLGDEAHLQQVLEITSQIQQTVANNLVSRQYRVAAACEAAAAHLGLAHCLAGVDAAETARQDHLRQALEASRTALNLYQEFGFMQIVECTSEEILYRHSLTLAASGREAEAAEYLKRAYDEMRRKHDLIPPDSPFRTTYLNMQLHRDIQRAYAAPARSEMGIGSPQGLG